MWLYQAQPITNFFAHIKNQISRQMGHLHSKVTGRSKTHIVLERYVDERPTTWNVAPNAVASNNNNNSSKPNGPAFNPNHFLASMQIPLDDVEFDEVGSRTGYQSKPTALATDTSVCSMHNHNNMQTHPLRAPPHTHAHTHTTHAYK